MSKKFRITVDFSFNQETSLTDVIQWITNLKFGATSHLQPADVDVLVVEKVEQFNG